MCGRFSLVVKKEKLAASLPGVELPGESTAFFQIAPTQKAWVVTADRPLKMQFFSWGLIPFWTTAGSQMSGKFINARAESIAEKPSFREPIRSRRCLVPADSFYEWRTGPGRQKIPFRIFLKTGDLLFFAGIRDEWRGGEGGTERTFSIITTEPNREMADIHTRMPVILNSENERQKWLENCPPDEILGLLRPPADGILTMHRVSEKLNSPIFNGPELHAPLPEIPTLFT